MRGAAIRSSTHGVESKAVSKPQPGLHETMLYTAVGFDDAEHRKTFLGNLCRCHGSVRLVSGADEWVDIHGSSPLTAVVGFSPWRVYPDLMHICDCAILPDSISSLLVEYVTVMPGARDDLLRQLREKYTAWCARLQSKPIRSCSPTRF